VQYTASSFQVVPPGVFHQNPSHQLRRNREEMGAIMPLQAFISTKRIYASFAKAVVCRL
jgi:hypothetical protein